MLLSKEVEVNLASPVIGHYEKLGYEIPRQSNRDGIMIVPRGTKIIVKVEDLPQSSDIKVLVKCDYCGDTTEKMYRKYLKARKEVLKDACSNPKCQKAKQKEVILNRYGVEHQSHIPSVQEKMAANRRKYNIKDIGLEFKERGYKLLSKKYTSVENKLEYICLKHEEQGIQNITYANFKKGQGCWYCGNEKIGDRLRHDYDFIYKEFLKQDCELLSDNYIDSKSKLYYRCNKHPDKIQTTTWSNFNRGHTCKYCLLEKSRLNRNITTQSSLINFLRGTISDWKNKSMKVCDYKCVLTGDKFDDIHHLYSFRSIVYETLDELGLELLDVDNYKNEDLVNIINQLNKNHDKHGVGVCLRSDIHTFFHKIYGYQNNTPEQFYEFKTRLKQGEFDDFLKENNLTLII